MEQTSYYVSMAAFTLVIAVWFVFFGTFLFRKKPEGAKETVKAPKSFFGIMLQGVGFAFVWALHRSPFLSPFVGDLYGMNIVLQVLAVALAIASVWLSIAAINELGRQWSFQARLVEDHKLVTTGVYGFVRHPIYTAMFGMLLATGIVLSHSAVLIPAAVIFLIGTFVRTKLEEKLLAEAFGREFEEWKAAVPGLIPFFPRPQTSKAAG